MSLELQRARLLDATFAVVAEQGYRGMAVRAVTERAGVSSKTFYDLFTDREDCFLAAFDHGIDQLRAQVRPAWESERDWTAGIRAGLAALLSFLDGEPALRVLVFVEALGAGPRVLARRAEVLQQLAGAIGEDPTGAKVGNGLPALTGEAVVGATLGVIHMRISSSTGRGDESPLIELLNGLMATIVLPYRGRAAAEREMTRSTTALSGGRGASRSEIEDPAHPAWRASHASDRGRRDAPPIGSLKPVDFRLTVRSQLVLKAIGELGEQGLQPNNQYVSELAGIADQGQISRLMMRLSDQGLVQNTRAEGQGLAKAWRLTPQGRAVLDTQPGGRDLPEPRRRSAGKDKSASKALSERGGASRSRTQGAWRASHASDRGRRDAPPIAAPNFRLTVRTHLVLTAIATLSKENYNPSNREISRAADIRDQGQISRLLRRLESHGLLKNTGGQTAGIPNAWQLTPKGSELLAASRPITTRATR